MKLLALILFLSIAVIPMPAQLTDANGDGVFQMPAQSNGGLFSERKLELILAITTAISGILAAVQRFRARQAHTTSEVLIRGIEMSGNSDVKQAVASVAAAEGHTQMITKKVNEVTDKMSESPKPSP